MTDHTPNDMQSLDHAWTGMADSWQQMREHGESATHLLSQMSDPQLLEITAKFTAFSAAMESFTADCRAFQEAAERRVQDRYAAALSKVPTAIIGDTTSLICTAG